MNISDKEQYHRTVYSYKHSYKHSYSYIFISGLKYKCSRLVNGAQKNRVIYFCKFFVITLITWILSLSSCLNQKSYIRTRPPNDLSQLNCLKSYSTSEYVLGVNFTSTLTTFMRVNICLKCSSLGEYYVECLLTLICFKPLQSRISHNSFLIVIAWVNIIFELISANREDYFIVGVTTISWAMSAPVRGAYPLCGQYPSTAIATMRVDCAPTTPPGRYVFIQQPANGIGYFNIAELEVYNNSSCWSDYETLVT